jgi:hypothetical protein
MSIDNLGYHDVSRIKRVEEHLNKLGFEISAGRSYTVNGMEDTAITLVPIGNELPHYSRDASIFIGRWRDVEGFLLGVQWARRYDETLKLSDTKKRSRKEQDIRNKQLMEVIKKGKYDTK